MMPTQILIPSEDETQVFEVELTATHEGVLLPPGVWMVRRCGDAVKERVEVERMPKRWRDEIDEAYRVSRMVRLDGPHCDSPGTGDD